MIAIDFTNSNKAIDLPDSLHTTIASENTYI